jgi:hypothetical protein
MRLDFAERGSATSLAVVILFLLPSMANATKGLGLVFFVYPATTAE